MSIRPVKRLVKSKPTLEGAGVHLRRAFGFGNTKDFDPFFCWTISATMFRRIIWQVSLASPSWDRDDHLCAGGDGGARRQHGEPRRHRRRRRAVDDGG